MTHVFVRAYNKITGAKLPHRVPAHFLGEHSPYPHLAPLPSSSKGKAASGQTDKTTAKKAVGKKATTAPGGSADTTKEQ